MRKKYLAKLFFVPLFPICSISYCMNNNEIQPRNLNAELYDAVNADEMMRSAKLDLIRQLVRLGANPNLSVGHEPLLFKVMRDEDLPLVQLLIDLGADVTQYDQDGYSIINRSIADGNNECFEFLLTLRGHDNARRIDVNAFDRHGRTPLMAAALHGNIDAMTRLLALGADPLLMRRRQFSLLHYAAEGGYLEAVRYVLALRHHRTGQALFNINMQAHGGITPVMTATGAGRLEVLREMLRREYESVDHTLSSEWTPLHYAAFAGRKDIIELLNSVGCPINARDKHGRTPLMCAAIIGSYEAVIGLIELGADVAITDSNGMTALHLVLDGYDAYSATKLSIMRALILAGASVHLTDTLRRSALSLAHNYDRRQERNTNHVRLEPQLDVWARQYLLTCFDQFNGPASVALSLKRQTEQKGTRVPASTQSNAKGQPMRYNNSNAADAGMVVTGRPSPINNAHIVVAPPVPVATAARATAAVPGRAS